MYLGLELWVAEYPWASGHLSLALDGANLDWIPDGFSLVRSPLVCLSSVACLPLVRRSSAARPGPSGPDLESAGSTGYLWAFLALDGADSDWIPAGLR